LETLFDGLTGSTVGQRFVDISDLRLARLAASPLRPPPIASPRARAWTPIDRPDLIARYLDEKP
jgi:hypothetical protein